MTDNTTITDPVSMAFVLAAGEGESFWWESQHRTADYVPGVPGPEAARHDLAVLGRAFEDAGLIITGPHPRDL